MAKQGTDQFANLATITITESGANTLTYKKLETGISLTEKVAWVISKLEYFYTGDWSNFAQAGDSLYAGLSVYNGITTFATAAAIVDPTLLDMFRLSRGDFGTAASGTILDHMVRKDFSNMPGGGIIVPPVPLYGWAQGVALTSAVTMVIKAYYTLLELSPDQYWQLVEARRVISS